MSLPLSPFANEPANAWNVAQVLQAAAVGLIQTTADGTVALANPRAAALVGRPPDSLRGLHLLELLHPEDGLPLQACLEQVLEGRATHAQRDSRWVTPEGRVVHLSLQITPVTGCPDTLTGPVAQPQAAHVTGLVLVLDDLTERRHMAALLDTARQAEQAHRAQTAFLSRMSHELRTPLNAMLGFAQVLRTDGRHPLSEAQRQKVDHIEHAGGQLLAMMNDVLDLSHIEAGRVDLSLQAVPVAEAAQQAWTQVASLAAQANLKVSFQVANLPGDRPLTVRADPDRLQQVLVNLLRNAIQYNRPGGLVQLEAWPLEGEVLLTVRDTGAGLTPQQMRHLFEPFNRLGAEHTTVAGTGIGLVIVRRLVEHMSGRLEVSSTPEQGSSFRVWLPQVAAAACEQATQAQPERPDRTRTVLYAEDNPINVELLRHIMPMRPHWHLVVAVSGQEAIDLARAEPPDLLLLDMHLGDMTGLDVSDALMVYPHTAALPRVALSADATCEHQREARARGFVDYLTKPLDVARFLAMLDQLACPPMAHPPQA